MGVLEVDPQVRAPRLARFRAVLRVARVVDLCHFPTQIYPEKLKLKKKIIVKSKMRKIQGILKVLQENLRFSKISLEKI